MICYFRHTGEENQFYFRSTTGELLKTIPLETPLTSTGGISWHPNGEVTFAAMGKSSFDIYRFDSEGKINLIMADGIHPAWSPDGKSLAFTTFRDGNLEVYLADHDGSLRNLTNHESMDARSSWSPDGTKLAFESERFGNLDVCVVDIGSGVITRLTDHPGKDWNPAWSPNGEIAFSSDRGGGNLIFIMGSDGTNVRMFDPAHQDDWQLSWSPDGKNQCFISNREGSFHLGTSEPVGE